MEATAPVADVGPDGLRSTSGKPDARCIAFGGPMPENESRPEPPLALEHTAVAVSELERSIEFYCDVIGFKLLRRTPTNAFLYLDDRLLELIQGDRQRAPGLSAAEEWQQQKVASFGLSHIGFRVRDLETTLAELVERGAAPPVVPAYDFVPEIGFVEHAGEDQLEPAERPRPGGTWKLAVVVDPDGTLLELVER